MPTLTIYLSNKLYEYVKSNPSKIVQQALKQMMPEKEVDNNVRKNRT